MKDSVKKFGKEFGKEFAKKFTKDNTGLVEKPPGKGGQTGGQKTPYF